MGSGVLDRRTRSVAPGGRTLDHSRSVRCGTEIEPAAGNLVGFLTRLDPDRKRIRLEGVSALDGGQRIMIRLKDATALGELVRELRAATGASGLLVESLDAVGEEFVLVAVIPATPAK